MKYLCFLPDNDSLTTLTEDTQENKTIMMFMYLSLVTNKTNHCTHKKLNAQITK